jgi:Spy/CpxP family protein refolding chaperone
MKRTVIIACLISLVATVGVFAQGGSTNAPPPMPPHPMRPMLNNLLPPHVFDELALTADQQAKYNTLNEGFKSDVAKLRASHESGGTNAVPGTGRQELRELRHGYIEKLRAFLTADQNAKLTQALENAREHRGGGPEGANPPPQPPPTSNPPPQPPPGNN